jgi:molybdopterin-binding protein
VGRQLMRTPFINPYDVRMIPLTFEGIVLMPERKDQKLEYIASYLWRYKPRNQAGFIPFSEGLGVEEDEGVLITGVRRRTKAWNYGLTNYWIKDPAGTIWLVGRARPIGREARVVIKSTDITLAKSRVEVMSVRTTLSGKVAGIDSDDGPIAGVSIALDGHGRLYALATRKAIDELGLAPGDKVFALVKTVALDERAVAPAEL